MPLKARFALPLLAATLGTSTARADDYRRPGLEGKWSERHLTAPMNSLRILAGPGQPAMMGMRIGDRSIDGGGQYVRRTGSGGEDEWWLRAGLGFGLTEDWEVGVLFLPFKFRPEFEFANVTVAITRGFRFENWDLGLRLSFQTPSFKAYDLAEFSFNPGVPFLYRAGPARFDAALLVPIEARDWSVGLNAPVRVSLSLSPRFFVAVESGLVEPRFGTRGDTALPLAALLGYSELFGNKVFDFTASFAWDDFWLLAPPSGRDAVDLGRYRVGFGIVSHVLVR